LDQLRKELEEERQLQELQRLQEEQTGKKRSEKLEWMYATPASGSGASANELEDYLLGKKRVDKMLTGDENAKVCHFMLYLVLLGAERFQVGASHKNFIAVQNANSARDTAAKVREDPLFAIKQQEQAAYQTLLSNPLRLKELQERNGIVATKKDKKREKHVRKEAKEEMKKLKALAKERAKSPRTRGRSPSTSLPGRHYDRSYSPDRSHRYRQSRSRSPRRRLPDVRGRHQSPLPPRRHNRSRTRPHDHDHSDRRRVRNFSISRSRSTSLEPDRRSGRASYRNGASEVDLDQPFNGSIRMLRPRDTYSRPASYAHTSPPDSRPTATEASVEADRAARLAAMSSSAQELTSERRQRLEAMLAQEREAKEREERQRLQHAKSGGIGGFLDGERRRVYAGGMEGGLAERIKRGRGNMVGVD
jgi:Pre-mRNA splicing factor